MNHQATITHVYHGVESISEVEDLDINMFYAKVTGTVTGITNAGSHITKLETVTV
jgi:hypothetical protein